ncbi:hypothetical protein MUO71_00745 [Candidatus Bathyarchaeota archaeon]|nr:hypothetical protein [Candidatus Bathyarchaeota archaeon]
MPKLKAVKIALFISLMVIGDLASVIYALVYSEKREDVYTNTLTVGANEVKFRAFYLSAPAGLFEVKLSVSKGTLKWTPHSAVMFEDTLGWFPCRITGKPFGTIQRGVCETDNGLVRWSVDQENVDLVGYINFFNQDYHEKEVTIEITKVREEQNYQDWV